MNTVRGIISALIASMTFGLIPLFTLPLLATGLAFNSLLFYRLFFAAVALAIYMGVRKKSFKVSWNDVPLLMILSACYTACSFFLLWGYQYISSGLATSLHFLYPVFVTIAMICFFGEKKSLGTGLSIFLAITGVMMLSSGDKELVISIFGITIILISAVWYAIYLVATNRSRASGMDVVLFTFCVLLFGAGFLAIYAAATSSFQMVPFTGNAWFNIIALALIPTMISNLALVDALHRVGSTITAVLGALEPLTAVCIGVFVFHEPFTQKIAYAIACIVASVLIIIVSRQMKPLNEWQVLQKIKNLSKEQKVD